MEDTIISNNDPNNIAFLYVIYNSDIPLLYLSCVCLNKYWQGPKNIIIVDDYSTIEYKSIINAVLPNWHITYLPACQTNFEVGTQYDSGWYRQQVYKLVAPIQTSYDWLIILDCKNLMIKKSYVTDFINNGFELASGAGPAQEMRESWPYTNHNEYALRMANESKHLVNGIDPELLIHTITPQIFNRHVLTEMNDKYEFTKMEHWLGTEFFTYWYYYNTYHRPKWMKKQSVVMGSLDVQFSNEYIFYNLYKNDTTKFRQIALMILLTLGIIDIDETNKFYKLLSNNNT
jgi:hypothetical protein